MGRRIDTANRRAGRTNPEKSGIRTGNPQLEAHESDQVRSSPRQRTPRRRGRLRVKSSEKRGA